MTVIRDNFEKSQRHICEFRAIHYVENEFADFQIALALLWTTAFIGTSVRKVFVNANTPFMKFRNRAVFVCAAIDALMPRPPIVSFDLTGVN